MKRAITPYIINDLTSKIILLTGPRQSGKTTLSKQLTTSYDYLNMDAVDHAQHIAKKRWDRKKELLILDEFHKFKQWKRFIKGVYDTEGLTPQIIITGSAKLDTYKNVGDSLAGRYFQYRLYPLDLQEACTYGSKIDPESAFDRLLICSGFPEPFLHGTAPFYKKWARTHSEIILKQDLVDLTLVRDIRSIEILAHLLRERVGGGVSFANLATDLQVDPGSVKKWIEILENMYLFFKVTPYHNKIARSLLKEPKVYAYDIASVQNKGAQLENLVAFSLLKRLHYLEDTQGCHTSLNYLRTKDGKEIDFLVTVDKQYYLIEVKYSNNDVSKHFEYFKPYFTNCKCTQLVKELEREYVTAQGIEVRGLVLWLARIDEEITV